MKGLAYSKPSLRYWTAEELDAIEATMSGGGGVSFSYITIVNNPSFGFGVAGHSGLLFCASLHSPCSLYSFGPYDNHTNGVEGSIAYIYNPEDGRAFNVFRSVCRRDGGIIIGNPRRVPWKEKFARFIQLGVNYEKYRIMLARANYVAAHPPTYQATGSNYESGYNCQAFVNDVLRTANIVLKTDAGASLLSNIVPNEVMDYASHASGASFMYKDRL